MPRFIRRKVLALFFVMLAGSLSASDTEIRIKSDVVVRGPFVLLGDIADVDGNNAEQSESLKKLELFPVPAPGRARAVRAFEIRQLLALHGFESEAIRVTGAGFARAPGSSRLTATISDSKRVANEPHLMTAPPANSRAGQTADPSTKANAVVMAKRAIAPGESIREIDVELTVPEKPILGGTAARSIDKVIGMEATRVIGVGQPVELSFLRKPILVQRGQPVTVTAKAAGVLVRTTARALDHGSSGDVIMLESLEKKEKYAAVVTGLQQAEVLAAGTTVSSSEPNR